MLSTDAVNKFRDIYLRKFGIELTTEEAIEQAERFLKISRVALQPMPVRLLRRYKEFLKEQEALAGGQPTHGNTTI